MANPNQEFERLMQRVRWGSQGAAQEVCARYGPLLRHRIRRRLPPGLRARYDSADFVQSVWASFFAAGPLMPPFEDADELRAYLTAMARNKVIDAARHRFRTPEDGMPAEPPARPPTPSQVAVAEEAWDRLRAGLPEGYCRILDLLREGHTHEEVARMLNVNEKTVRRLLRLIVHRVVA